MEQTAVLEYKCPCCDAGLHFSGSEQKLSCEYCGNTFEIDAVKAFNEDTAQAPEFQWEEPELQPWEDDEDTSLFSCPTCAGQIIGDAHTAATFCPYCGNPTVLPTRLSGAIKPDGVLPFQKTREDAKAAFLQLCKGKPLLPREFTSQQQIEKITGLYVPFWLYDCQGDFTGRYKATRVRTWSDSDYRYTETSHYLLVRQAEGAFVGVPMDGSSKIDDVSMESIEPFDYSQLTSFDTAYLSGYFADKYDVSSEAGAQRLRQRVENAFDEAIAPTMLTYTTKIPTGKNLKLDQGKARYVLMPVWLLNTRYKDKTYTFAMNGQTGKMTGQLPVCPKRALAWFAGVCAGATALAWVIQALVL